MEGNAKITLSEVMKRIKDGSEKSSVSFDNVTKSIL